MTAATAPRMTPQIEGTKFVREVAAGKKIYAGTIVALAAGYATPGATALNLVADGRAVESVDNTGGQAGDERVTIEKGTFRFMSAGGADQITRTEIGRTAYLVDDQTVAATNGGGTRSPAGTVMGLDGNSRGLADRGVWVRFS